MLSLFYDFELLLARVKDVKMQIQIYSSASADNEAKKNRAFLRMQQALIAAQELGDEKMKVLQNILDKIEVKTKQLNHDFKNLG